MKITTNNVPRFTIQGQELSEKERSEFDYYEGDDLLDATFVRYKGRVYDVGQFIRLPQGSEEQQAGYHGSHQDSAFSGVLVKLCGDGDRVIMAAYCS